jgi:hypothetical protein
VNGHQELLTAAIERDGEGQRALFAGDEERARAAFREAAELYRRSWEEAPPASYGRLVGLLKSSVLAGEGAAQARYAQAQLGDDGEESPTASYAQALAALILGDDAAAEAWSRRMRTGSEAFTRTGDAILALATDAPEAYAAAARSIVEDFERRADHLTGVAVADTALVLQRLAARRGLAADLSSPVLPTA